MKLFTAALISATLIVSSANAGNLVAPMMEDEVIIEEASASSGSDWLIPLFALVLFAAAVSGSSSSGAAPVPVVAR